jgi:hypothetical protein
VLELPPLLSCHTGTRLKTDVGPTSGRRSVVMTVDHFNFWGPQFGHDIGPTLARRMTTNADVAAVLPTLAQCVHVIYTSNTIIVCIVH